MTGGVSASDEFVELYNPTASAQSLEGLELVYVTATGATITRKAVWGSGGLFSRGGHLLVANEAGLFAGIADATYAGGLAAAGGSMALRTMARRRRSTPWAGARPSARGSRRLRRRQPRRIQPGTAAGRPPRLGPGPRPQPRRLRRALGARSAEHRVCAGAGRVARLEPVPTLPDTATLADNDTSRHGAANRAAPSDRTPSPPVIADPDPDAVQTQPLHADPGADTADRCRRGPCRTARIVVGAPAYRLGFPRRRRLRGRCDGRDRGARRGRSFSAGRGAVVAGTVDDRYAQRTVASTSAMSAFRALRPNRNRSRPIPGPSARRSRASW